MLKLVFQFLVSGTVVVLATALGQKVGQKWAGLLVAFPIWTILTYVFLSFSDKNVNHHEYLLAAVIFMIPAAVFIVSLMYLSRFNLWLSLLGGLLLYSIAALFAARFV